MSATTVMLTELYLKDTQVEPNEEGLFETTLPKSSALTVTNCEWCVIYNY